MVFKVNTVGGARFWNAIDYAGVPFISWSLFWFSLSWTQQRMRRTLTAGGVAAALIAFTGILFNDRVSIFRAIPWGLTDSPAPNILGAAFYAAVYIEFYLYAILSLRVLVRAYRQEPSPIRKLQYRNFIIAFFAGYSASTDVLISFGVPLFPSGFLSYSAFILIVAYNIARHQFLDVRLAFRRATALLAVYTVLIAIGLPLFIPLAAALHARPGAAAMPTYIVLSLATGAFLSLGPFIYAYLVRTSVWLKARMTDGLTHELKSPLGVIRSTADIILSDINAGRSTPEKTAEYMAIVQRNSERLETFVASLLDLVHASEDRPYIAREPVDLSAVIENAVRAHQPSADAKGVSINFSKNGVATTQGDEPKLYQVLSNLLSNSIKYSSEGEVGIKIDRWSNELAVSVSDTGRGIARTDLSRVFERFYQGAGSAKGSGIGLSIAKGWVEAHGGRIWAESEGEGKGTTVTFTLPACVEALKDEPEEAVR
jgi:signal transduction histidine kinase